MSTSTETFASLDDLARYLRDRVDKKYVLLFAFNGTGKTRLSMVFKDLGKDGDARDTLYFNAFTEDLFYWDNDLEGDAQRVLRLNTESRFFDGLQALEMENRIRPLLRRYADVDFMIDYDEGTVNFLREIQVGGRTETIEHIKVSRGEENIFVWCFFLAVAQLAVDQEEGSLYGWVKYIYIDDPISSLDDNNAIAVASHVAQLLKGASGQIRTVISTHHHLFFNVLWNELNGRGQNNPLQPLYLNCDKKTTEYSLRYTQDTPFFSHVALLRELVKAAESDEIYTYHFNILRGILERTATFHGFRNFSACIRQGNDDPDGILHARLINVLSHGNYSLYDPQEMLPENKGYFRKILRDFMSNYRFNPELFPASTQETEGA
jgi:wobble nucleotide-excising tRNase